MFNMVPFRGRGRDRQMMNWDRGLDRLFDIFDTSMSTDIVDKGDYYELVSDMPGLKKEDIKVSMDDRQLMITVDKKDERSEKSENYVLQERRSYNYSRRFDLTGIDKEKITGNYKDGVLNLKLPKLEKEEEQAYLDIEFDD
mgnify:CR=1 FL=1